MITLTDTDIVDLTTTTLKELGRMKFTQIAQRIQDYEVAQRIFKKDKVQFSGGTGISRNVMTDYASSARQTGLYEKDNVNVGDVMATISIPWRHTTNSYAFERREITMNSGDPASTIVDLLKVRRSDCLLSTVEQFEQQFWNKPTDSTNVLDVYGVPYWIVKNDTVGFSGAAPSGFSAGAGGLLNPRWQNWSGKYTTISKADLILKMRNAHRKIQFKSPIDTPSYRMGSGQSYRIYVNEPTLVGLESVGESQNEQLGRDIASMDDNLVFRKNPIVWVPYLDSDTSNPVYFIDFNQFAPVFLNGEFMRETEVKPVPGQHNTFAVFVDTTWNVLCTDRRRQAVLHTGV